MPLNQTKQTFRHGKLECNIDIWLYTKKSLVWFGLFGFMAYQPL